MMTFDFLSQHAISPRSNPYDQALSSSASSSTSSVFDTASQTSETSSTSSTSGDHGWEADVTTTWRTEQCPEPCRPVQAPATIKTVLPPLHTVEALPAQQRQHPRRCSVARPPPALVRQSERKEQFVDGLVDSATQMVEVIWPLSVPAYSAETCTGKGVLPLRTFIQETLRRSRTSFSTLQVAMYYLILIKAHVPKCDFTMEQPLDAPSLRALQCGRRMFLAALILASKYLQDRNYSARAWSKISGLRVCEINTNEIAFLKAVSWRLHIEAKLFERWQFIVMSHTPPSQATGLHPSWREVIPRLTPELNTIEVGPRASPLKELRRRHVAEPEPLSPLSCGSPTEVTTPITCRPPRFLEPNPDMLPPTPCLPRMGPLPTPQLTPQTSVAPTPAASYATFGLRRPSMCAAMAQANNACIARTVLDKCAFSKFNGLEQYAMASRRPSLAGSLSSVNCSPESMISDSSMRSSRASSVSSVSSKISLPYTSAMRPKLARVATLRCAGLNEIREKEVLPTSANCDFSSPDLEAFHINDSPVPAWKAAQQQLAAEREAELAMNATRSAERPSPCRKRGRSSVDMSILQQSIRGALRESPVLGANVVPDANQAKSFLFENPGALGNLNTPSDGVATPVNSTKRARRSSGRDSFNCSTQARQTAKLEGGPGMWSGIL